MNVKKKRNPRSCDSCRKDKRGCSGGENGVRSCERCSYKRLDCSYIGEFIPLRGHCEDHLEFENTNRDITNSQNFLDELPSNCNILNPPTGLVDFEYYDFRNLSNDPDSISQIKIPQAGVSVY
ncbi:4601_t:CDS:2 [Gigaspora margarita]|uniref:4601_t:CDS:1 n=1 Tax=Gigaspora margarita TaxID=4874 RepID=A0ABM8W2U8_GIGMA|nr:4601_t:CDS:2 [Gigaspora margarita]